jgi:glucosamine 6-phosphate synthetase-like amidotransferase/phosphosugar isomerase protein
MAADPEIRKAASALASCERIVLVACGTSYYACLGAKTLLERFGIVSEAVIGS